LSRAPLPPKGKGRRGLGGGCCKARAERPAPLLCRRRLASPDARNPAYGWASRKRACQPPKPEGTARNRSRVAGATGCLRARAGRSAWARRAGGSSGQRGAGAKGGRKRAVSIFGGAGRSKHVQALSLHPEALPACQNRSDRPRSRKDGHANTQPLPMPHSRLVGRPRLRSTHALSQHCPKAALYQ
jgi:hypothetical protein